MSTIRNEITGRRGGDAAVGTIPPKLALTIREFCALHGISEAFYYDLQKRRKGPRVMHVGARRLISVEEAARWRAARTSKKDAA